MASVSNTNWRDHLPPKLEQTFSLSTRIKGIVIFALVAVGITAYILFASNQLLSLPQNLAHAFTHINPSNLAIGLGVPTLLVGGAAFVIYRTQKLTDRLVHTSIPSQPVIEEAVVTYPYPVAGQEAEVDVHDSVYIDKSTLTAEGSGLAYLYTVKDSSDHYVVSSIVSLTTPIYLIGSVVYHIIRMCVVPFYVAGCWVVERFRSAPLFEGQRKFELVDIVKEPWKSLKQVVTSPFYALAYMFCSLYSLVNPIRGRILASKVERDWNDGVSRTEGFWSVQGRQRLWAGWGELGPEKLGLFKLYWAGCWQPIGVVEYNEGRITRGMSLSRAVLTTASEGGEYSHIRTANSEDE